ncbi:formate/nitrite transporter family protein [Euzebya sp.]|uniref:formate/nitrite transporter family protein n=1 Tax=Euzebya sp. TaxID=1971409 RepID=UPI003510F69D
MSADHEQPRSPSGAPSGGEAVEDILSADDIFQRVAATADDEFQRRPRPLFFSGIAAGLSIGLTFLARAALGSATESIGELPGDLLYPIGFILVALGRYQLFTENTLTPVTLVLTRLASLPALLRLWGIVVVANLIGAGAAAWLMSAPNALDPLIEFAARELAAHALEEPIQTLFVRGVMAGGVVASMVWLVHAVREGAGRVLVVYATMILIPVADLYHCITGFCEVVYGVIQGEGTVGQAFAFFGAVAAGNIAGGVVLVAFTNFGQADASRFPERSTEEHRLSWRELLLGYRTGGLTSSRVAPERDEAATHAGGSA